MKLTFLQGTALGSAVAVAMLTATSAMAGTGVGGVFNLGKSNTVNATSGLTGTAAGPMLAITAKGGGPALGLHVRAGKAPITVNSTAEVKNLNASLLGGLSPASFVRGGGQDRAFGFTLAATKAATLLSIPGYGTLEASCTTSFGAEVDFTNGQKTVDIWQTSAGTTILSSLSPSQFYRALLTGTGTAGAELLIHYTTGSGHTAAQHVATVQTGASFDGSSTCTFVAEAYLGPGQTAP